MQWWVRASARTSRTYSQLPLPDAMGEQRTPWSIQYCKVPRGAITLLALRLPTFHINGALHSSYLSFSFSSLLLKIYIYIPRTYKSLYTTVYYYDGFVYATFNIHTWFVNNFDTQRHKNKSEYRSDVLPFRRGLFNRLSEVKFCNKLFAAEFQSLETDE